MSIYCPFRAALAAGISLACLNFAFAQNTPGEADIVLTPERTPQSISRSGSAISVIRQDEILKSSPKSTADLLRQVPGISLTETGGPGQTMHVRIRGADSRNTLVLVDGIRVNDPSAGSGEFDFASLVPADIERIEVLRGPQSALYGSDAIGGVINIITRKGRGAPKGFASVETGRYGTTAGKAGVSGGTSNFDYAMSISGAKSAGFSTYGYRIGRAHSQQAWPLENDGYNRLGGAARFAWRPFAGMEIETGITSSATDSQYDAAFGARPDTGNKAQVRMTSAFTKLSLDAFEGRLKNSVTVFGNHTDRSYDQASFSQFGARLTRDWSRFSYFGKRFGGEYQGDLNLDRFGKLIFGARMEQEELSSRIKPIESAFTRAARENSTQMTRSLFLLHQLPIGDRTDVSVGGRIDSTENGATFRTWRITGAHRITEFGTKLRASAGTGAKAPTLFQSRSGVYGTASLQAEESFGVDAGFDQALFGGRLNLSVTGFSNRFTNLIDFSPFNTVTFNYPDCPAAQRVNGCFLNIARAKTSGVEVAGDAIIIDGWLRAKLAYTHMEAIDTTTRKHLARRPEHEGRVGLVVTPIEGLSIEPTVFLVGKRWSSQNETQVLRPYARFDVLANYRVHTNLDVFARVENLSNAKYQEVRDYGTTGRAFYVGARATW